jgi:hypothetical protein
MSRKRRVRGCAPQGIDGADFPPSRKTPVKALAASPAPNISSVEDNPAGEAS